MSGSPRAVRFRNFEERTAEESQIVMNAFVDSGKALPGRIMAELARLDEVVNGFPISVAQHSLQTATRAFRDGAGEEMVVVALLHDLGEGLCPTNHANNAADTIGPYVSEDLEWLLRHHTIFQGYYFFHHYGRDRNLREQFRGHRMFQATADFCAQGTRNPSTRTTTRCRSTSSNRRCAQFSRGSRGASSRPVGIGYNRV